MAENSFQGSGTQAVVQLCPTCVWDKSFLKTQQTQSININDLAQFKMQGEDANKNHLWVDIAPWCYKFMGWITSQG